MPGIFQSSFSVILALTLLAGAPLWAADNAKAAAALGLLRQIDEGFVAVFDKVAPSVVVIEARKRPTPQEDDEDSRSFDSFFKDNDEPGKDAGKPLDKDKQRQFRLPQAPTRSEGSGFVIRADGYILTNQHVVADAEKLSVRLRDGRIFPARVVGFDDKTDIAVLHIEAKDLPVAELGDSEKLRVGQLVCAIGTPFNQDYSFSCGWVSGKGRNNLLGPISNTVLYEDYIQTDAFINPGNSGGPLFDVSGSVIGMNTLINGIGRGLAFAIPSNMLSEVSAQLIATGHVVRPWLGIRIETLSENSELREKVNIEKGIVVRTIEANAPAHRSDLRSADIITELDGVKLATAHDLQKEVLKKKVGQSLQLTVWRAGVTMKIPVLTGELPAADLTKTGAKKPAEPRVENWGLKLGDYAKGGAVIVEIVPQSVAAKSALQAQDIILEVDGKPVATSADAVAALALNEKKSVPLSIERNGKRSFAVLEKQK